MRLLLIILSTILAILGVAMSILPFGSIALIPIVLSFVFGLIAFKMANKEGKSVTLIKVIFFLIIIATGLTIYNTFQPNEIVEDSESVENEKISDEDMEELESIEIED